MVKDSRSLLASAKDKRNLKKTKKFKGVSRNSAQTMRPLTLRKPNASDAFAAGQSETLAEILEQLAHEELLKLVALAQNEAVILRSIFAEAQRRMKTARENKSTSGAREEAKTQEVFDAVCPVINRQRRKQSSTNNRTAPPQLPPAKKASHLLEYDELVRRFNNLLRAVMMPANTPEAIASQLRSQSALEKMGQEFEVWAKKYPAKFFPWPSTFSAGGGRRAEFDRVKLSPLAVLGYQVGNSSRVSVLERRRLLDWVFQNLLPPVESPDYIAKWGPPRTAARLERMAKHIANLGKLRRRFAGPKDKSVRDWQADLDYLKRRFYNGMKFIWPNMD